MHPLDVGHERVVTGLAALSDDPHWRAYVEALHPHGLLSGGSGPTQPPEPRSLQEAVLASRRAQLVERAMGRLHGRPVSLPPRSLEQDDQATVDPPVGPRVVGVVGGQIGKCFDESIFCGLRLSCL